MLAPFILQAERLRGDEIGIDKGDFIGVLHRKVDVLRLAESDLVVVGILQRHLVAAQMRKDVVASVLPGAGSVEDIRQLVDQRGLAA